MRALLASSDTLGSPQRRARAAAVDQGMKQDQQKMQRTNRQQIRAHDHNQPPTRTQHPRNLAQRRRVGNIFGGEGTDDAVKRRVAKRQCLHRALDYINLLGQPCAGKLGACRRDHLRRTINRLAAIARLRHIHQQIANAAANLQHIMPMQARQDQPLPDTPLPGKGDRAGKPVQQPIFIEEFKQAATQPRLRTHQFSSRKAHAQDRTRAHEHASI